MSLLKKVVIIGKTNVGKSQLFNRIVGQKHSIVFDESGITRDRITLIAEWLKYKFFLTDTGGYSVKKKNNVQFQEEINQQSLSAIDEADLIIFVISKKDGIDEDDVSIAKLLKAKKNTPNILVVNKCDTLNKDHPNFFHLSLGLGEGISVSAEHGVNIGVLLDLIVDQLNIFNQKQAKIEYTQTEKNTFAIIGKPNVGKSSLCNALLQQERLIVSPVAGTTRDAVDLVFSYQQACFTLIDTPGIKKNKFLTNNKVEYLSILKAKQSIKRANFICLVIDVADGIKEMDEKIAGLIHKANIPSMIIANKWDLVSYKSDKQRRDLELEIKKKMPYISWVPIVFVSAKHSEKLSDIFSMLKKIKEECVKKVSDYELNNFLIRITSLFSIPRVANKTIELYDIKQIQSQIPTFIINCSDIKLLHFSYSRMVENKLRETFGFKICPIKIFFRSKKK